MKQMIGSFVLVYGVIVVLMKHMFFIRAYHDILIRRHQEQAMLYPSLSFIVQ